MTNAQIVIVFQSKEVMSHNLALKNKTWDTTTMMKIISLFSLSIAQ
jgi:hypothetical protein